MQSPEGQVAGATESVIADSRDWRNSFYEAHEDTYTIDATLRMKKTIKQSQTALGGRGGGPVTNARTFGTLTGVYLPCLQNILGVILFLRLPWIVGQAGVLLTLGIVVICVSTTSLTTLSMSALATNGKKAGDGPYGILLSNLGPEFAGSIGVLFYLGTTIAATMYTLGGVEAIYTNFAPTPTTEFFPFDRQVIGIVWSMVLGSVVFAGMKWVVKVSLIFLVTVLSAVFFMWVGGLLFAGGGWAPPGVKPTLNMTENLFPNFTFDETTGTTPDATFLIALFFPSVTGIMAGSNRSAVLMNPGRSIPSGTLGAIFTTTLFYVVTILLFGFAVSNETLLNNKLVAAFIAWPHQYVVAVGIIMSCIGAGMQSLAGAPQLLRGIANDGHIPFLRGFGTSHPSGEPKRAVVVTTTISALCCLAGNLDYITPIITMFFLGMYGAINMACFLSSVLHTPSFRPSWKYFHWLTALAGFLLCLTLMFIISVLYSFVAIALASFIFLYIRSSREQKEWGDAMFGLRLDQAKNALLELSLIRSEAIKKDARKGPRSRLLEEDKGSMRKKKSCFHRFRCFLAPCISCASCFTPNDDEDEAEYGNPAEDVFDDSFDGSSENMLWGLKERNWRPQILVLCKISSYEFEGRSQFSVTHPVLLQLASQLKKGGGLTIVNSIMHGDVMDHRMKKKCAKARWFLANVLLKYKVKGFSDVILDSGKALQQSLSVLFQSNGLGMLSPNTVMLAWPHEWREDRIPKSSEQIQEEQANPLIASDCRAHQEAYVKVLKQAIACENALIVVKAPSGLPRRVTGGTIDVWWLLHDGDMLVLIPYLLKRHKTWAAVTLRIFAIADDLVDFEASRKVILEHLEELRITAVVEMIHVGASHARDVDQNRTVILKSSPTHGTILSADFFQPLTADEQQIIPVLPLGEGSGGAAHPNGRHTGILRKLRRSNTSESDLVTQDPEAVAKKVAEIAKFIGDSSGDDTRRWIKGKYAEAAPLQSLFGPMEQIGEGNEDEECEDESSSAPESISITKVEPEVKVSTAPAAAPLQAPASVAIPPPVTTSATSTIPQTSVVPQHTDATAKHGLQDTRSGHNLEENFDATSTQEYKERAEVLLKKALDSKRLAKRLMTATYLNQKIREHSSGASLVVLNLPLSRVTPSVEFIKYTEELSRGLLNVIMLRGAGTEQVATL
eukprot:CAMPEP_0184552476 /NCGR_PEP_ID=MMETSP0199_2-20130426/29099_1 /TAXON_ID=1112570 /ORGANISM="Thraustochytrium sp., Strain LLF1b" /LENGTH=1180 /DNA_ID=CAMNT_0026947971 /DNA_START=237 /DNA_END=3779 /DNA_ORIENTATION=+